ncbi:toxin glutamine deamidase domain-containing protein [Streptomyces sp. NPDC059690]|uniref:toxin glutamine deamidase domain-containing protein n=1 Tax=Streptomyces sp. NPDC059690 TaxID=3346907 RepID=UPI00369D85C6
MHTPIRTPGTSAAPNHAAGPATPHAPGSPQTPGGDTTSPNHPNQDSLQDIRSDLDHYPGGLTDPDPADQQALSDAVPRNEDGTTQRYPDPFDGNWSQLQNDGGVNVPGRSNNCADCSRSFLETWYGNPQVSAPRTLDTDANGKPDLWSPEDNANDNQIRWTGASHTYAGPGGDPNTANNIANTLQQAGPGSAAIVQVDWPGGGGHAFNVVNHNGKIVWIDTQSGQVSTQPLHIDQATHVWHIPLDANRNPIDTSQPPTNASQGHTNSQNQSSSQNPNGETSQPENSGNDGQPENSHNPQDGASADTPKQQNGTDEEPGSPRQPHDPESAAPSDATDPPKSSSSDQDSPDARGGDRRNEDNRDQVRNEAASKPDTTSDAQEPSRDTPADPRASQDETHPDEHQEPRQPSEAPSDHRRPSEETTSTSDRPSHPEGATHTDERSDTSESEQPTGTRDTPTRPESPGATDPHSGDQDHTPYSDPHDRGQSDTSDESHRVTEDGPDSDTSRTHAEPESEGSREYGIEPDALQQALRQQRSVHRVELDRVHDSLDRWANSGELANALRTSSGDGPDPNSPRTFTRQQLSDQLDGFDRLSRGEQQAVVASLARLSFSFHRQHSVGVNPERISRPYRGENEGDPAPKTPDRGAKLSKESLGVRLHRMAVNQIFKKAAFKKLPTDEASKVRRHGPDFSGKNFAVLEVQGPPPDHDITYVVDSSVPANQKLPGVQPRHSERHLLDWLKRVDPEGTNYKPLGLYTEREPCGQGEGHMKCSTVLGDDRFKDVPIHYSTTYRDDPAGVAIRKQMLAERDATIKQLKGMPEDEIKQRMKEQWSERYKDDEKRLAKALDRLEGQSGPALISSISKELDAQRKETRTPEEKAITAEFDRHIDVLRETWDKILPALRK